MEFIEFKIPKKIESIFNAYPPTISHIKTDENGFQIAFQQNPISKNLIILDFDHVIQDYRVKRLQPHHPYAKLVKPWPLIEIKNSEYLKNMNEDENGILLFIFPKLIHYISGDNDYSIDIISRGKPEIYLEKHKLKNLK